MVVVVVLNYHNTIEACYWWDECIDDGLRMTWSSCRWGKVGWGEGTLKRKGNCYPPEKEHHNTHWIPVCVEPEEGFCFVCHKSNLVSRVLTNTGVAVIRLANKYPCPFHLPTHTPSKILSSHPIQSFNAHNQSQSTHIYNNLQNSHYHLLIQTFQ